MIKNIDVLRKAEEVVNHAKALGFDDACIEIQDEEGDVYSNMEDVVSNYNPDEELVLKVFVCLTEDLEVHMKNEDPDDEDSDTVAVYP